MSEQSTIKSMPLAFRLHLHGELIAHGIVPSCVNCAAQSHHPVQTQHGVVQYVTCGRYNDAVVPFDVIAKGCEGWQQEVPF
jgi:hypothetical protein